jgi:hypothetical protein
LIPDINSILGPEKYAAVNDDIRQGLNIILVGDEKFANSMVKVEVFLERLKQARKAFLVEFLQPEIDRVCAELGFKVPPTAYFEDIDLKDQLQYAKLYTQLMQMGVLTPSEGLKAIETDEFPSTEESVEHQKELRKLRDDGLYEPLIGGPKDAAPGEMPKGKGRPAGTKAPQSTKKVSPIGASTISMAKLKETIEAADSTIEAMEKAVKARFKLKTLSKEQKDSAFVLAKQVMANEPIDVWPVKAADYAKNPQKMTEEVSAKIDSIMSGYDVDDYLAILISKSLSELIP